MEILTWTYILVGLSFAIYIGIAIYTRASSTKEFYTAGGGVSPLANGMATAADWMSAASFISMAGIIAFSGYDGSVYLMGWTGGYVLLALLLAPYLRKFGKFTVPDFVGDRYYSNKARVVAVFCALFISFTYVAGQMRGVGIVFSRYLEVDINTGVIIGMAIVFFYAVLGGMKGITYTQVAQYCVLIFAFMVPAIFVSMQLTGHPVPQLGLGSTVQGGEPYLLDKLDGILGDLGFQEYTSGRKPMTDIFAITLALMVGTAGLPHVIVRFFTVPRVKDARLSAGFALVFIAILYTTAPAVAAFGIFNAIDTVAGQPVDQLPQWVENWQKTNLIAIHDINGDGVVQYTPYEATNELHIDKDIMVLAAPEIAKLPNWVVGLVAAGGMAAALSTAAGLLLVISTAVSRDLFRTFVPSMTEKTELIIARVAAATAVIIAGYFGVNPPGFVAEVVAFAFGLAAASFFPVIIMGIFSTRMNKEGAIAGMISGLVFTMGYIIYFKFISPELNTADHWWLGVSPEGIGTLGMLLNFVACYAVSKITPAPPQNVQDMIQEIRIPRGAGSAHNH